MKPTLVTAGVVPPTGSDAGADAAAAASGRWFRRSTDSADAVAFAVGGRPVQRAERLRLTSPPARSTRRCADTVVRRRAAGVGCVLVERFRQLENRRRRLREFENRRVRAPTAPEPPAPARPPGRACTRRRLRAFRALSAIGGRTALTQARCGFRQRNGLRRRRMRRACEECAGAAGRARGLRHRRCRCGRRRRGRRRDLEARSISRCVPDAGLCSAALLVSASASAHPAAASSTIGGGDARRSSELARDEQGGAAEAIDEARGPARDAHKSGLTAAASNKSGLGKPGDIAAMRDIPGQFLYAGSGCSRERWAIACWSGAS